MNSELKKLLAKINAKKAEVKNLVSDGKLEDAKNAKEELQNLQQSFDLLHDLDEEERQEAERTVQEKQPAGPSNKKPSLTDTTRAFVNAIKAGLKGKPVAEQDITILNAGMNESDVKEDGTSDGGLTVPRDIATKIIELRRAAADDLEKYVNVEPVTTKSGSRPIEIDADSTPWPDVDEGEEFTEQDTPQFKEIKYEIKKRGGILKITEELLADTAENIMAYIRKWIAKKSRATRNARILTAIGSITTGEEITVTDVDSLKKIFNIVLDPAIAEGASVFTNQTGFNWLDTLKDKDDKYVLQPSVTEPTKMMLFGKYPVIKLSDKVLKNAGIEGGVKAPFLCGNLSEAVTLFDRERLTIDINNIAGDLWKTDKTGIKVRDRFDVQTVDDKAVVKGEVTITTAG